MAGHMRIRSAHLIGVLVAAILVGTIAVLGFTLVYRGKIYPGVSVDGLYLGGLDRAGAIAELQSQVAQYHNEQLTVQYAGTSLTIPVKSLGVNYSNDAVTAALAYGRQGSFAEQIRDRLRSIFGRSANFSNYHYDSSALTPALATVDDAVAQPVANASLSFDSGQVTVAPSQPGHRLDRGLLTLALDERLANLDVSPVTAPVYLVLPSINEDTLSAARHQADGYVAAPLTITTGTQTQTVDQSQILSWIDIKTVSSQSDLPLDPLQSFYPRLTAPSVALTLNPTKVNAYVASLAGSIDQTPQNAVLGWQNNALTVVTASHPGLSLDQAKATAQIIAAVSSPTASRNLNLPTAVTQAAVNEQNLASLGITQLISEGQTTFPGSSTNRIINVTVGASKFNDVLLAPGQMFSFGQILGPVGPEQGYKPGLVILGNHEENQYGGGLCQVASTAFRAALLAGLPINERHNHSYAVSFYTAPYGVPGVDATIFYPQVDLKFTNDTGHYILIQTAIAHGDQLTFDFYGTKTKSGTIIPPHFIYGTTDPTQPSETQFQRQVLDLNGNVIKTDSFTQYYQSSNDFPIEQTSNGA